MHRPQRDQLTKPNPVDCVRIPQAHGENTRVVGELDLEVALGGFVLFTGFGHVVKVHDAAHESEITGTRLKGTQIGFFIVESGLENVSNDAGEGGSALAVHGVDGDNPAVCRTACTSSMVKPSLFFVGDEVKND